MSVLATDGDGVRTLSSPLARHGASPLLRKGVPGEKKPLKEKLLTYYEQIFQVAVTSLVPRPSITANVVEGLACVE